MPQRKSGIRELRINDRRHLRNLQTKTDLKKSIKQFKSLVDQKKAEEAKSVLNTVYKRLDKATKRRILPKNTASRRKAQFSRILASIT